MYDTLTLSYRKKGQRRVTIFNDNVMTDGSILKVDINRQSLREGFKLKKGKNR